MHVEQIYTGCLAQGAYYIRSGGEAAIVDPLREVEPYLERLAADGVELKYIFETHFHADFVSGHVTLAQRTGAPIVYGPGADPVSIGRGCRIKDAIIGPDVSIGDHAVVERSIVRDSIVGRYARLHDVSLAHSVVGNDTSLSGQAQVINIGDNTELEFG